MVGHALVRVEEDPAGREVVAAGMAAEHGGEGLARDVGGLAELDRHDKAPRTEPRLR